MFDFALRHSHALAFRLALALALSLAFLSRLFFVDPGLPGKWQPGLQIIGTKVPSSRAIVLQPARNLTTPFGFNRLFFE
jgi:hypothetical protein